MTKERNKTFESLSKRVRDIHSAAEDYVDRMNTIDFINALGTLTERVSSYKFSGHYNERLNISMRHYADIVVKNEIIKRIYDESNGGNQ